MSIPADVSTLADMPRGIRERLLEGDPEPALQLFPPLSDRDLKDLRVSVEARGVRVPVELEPDGRVLDGHHRLEVAAELELDPGEIPVTVRDDLQRTSSSTCSRSTSAAGTSLGRDAGRSQPSCAAAAGASGGSLTGWA